MKRTKMAKKISMKMPMTAISAATLELCAVFCGCDGGGSPLKRRDAAYEKAMADYSAGRIEAATESFIAAVKTNPANADAWFQLAVLMQDFRKDCIGALACYRVYNMLSGESDKSGIAAERSAQCEAVLAGEIARRANLADVSGMMKELDAERAKAAAAVKDAAADAKARAIAEKRADTLEKEIASLRKILSAMRDVPEEDGAGAHVRHGTTSGAPAAGAGDDDDGGPVVLNPEAKALFEEEEGASASNSVEPAGGSAAVRPNMETAPRPASGASGTSVATQEIPKRWHVVQEGETLGEISKKYYGKKSSWRKIQDANKAIVPQDGKVRAGVKLQIP